MEAPHCDDMEVIGSFTEDDWAELDYLESANDAGDLDTCRSASCGWYRDAADTMQDYLQRMQALDTASTSMPSEHPPPPQAPDDAGRRTPSPPLPPADDDDFFPTDRSASYGEVWEDEPLADWQPEAILKRQRRKGVTYYLVRWRGQRAEDTWETEEDLEEEGHAPLVNTFLKERERRAAEEEAEQQARRKPREVSQKKGGPEKEPLPVPLIMEKLRFDPTVYWPDFLTRIAERFTSSGLTATKVYNVCNRSRADEFTSLWRKSAAKGGNAVPAMLFHGTHRECVRSIALTGLRIPNRGANPVAVANGSAHGVGVYTAVRPSFSFNYTRGLMAMFVCAGLIEEEFSTTVKHTGEIAVFFEESQVVPCFLVCFEGHSGSSAPVYHDSISVAELQEIVALPQGNPATLSPFMQKYLAMRQRYDQGIAAAGAMPGPGASSIRAGGGQGCPYDDSRRTLTKKQLRAAPRAAKDAYKAGFLVQKKN